MDPLVEKFLEQGGEKTEIAKKVHGQIAIASAKGGISNLQGDFRQ